MTKQLIKSSKSSKSKVNSQFKYSKLCAFDRKCFIHKDKTNKMFCDMIIKNLSSQENKKILCLDSAKTKTSNMLISNGICTKQNIVLIEANNSTYQKHVSNGFNCIQGNCSDILTQYQFNPMDGIYLDAIGSVGTVGQLVFDALTNIINKSNTNRCVLGYTFVKRGKSKGQTFISTYGNFLFKFNCLLSNYNYKITDTESYSYGNPKNGQACMFTEFVCIEKITSN